MANIICDYSKTVDFKILTWKCPDRLTIGSEQRTITVSTTTRDQPVMYAEPATIPNPKVVAFGFVKRISIAVSFSELRESVSTHMDGHNGKVYKNECKQHNT